MYISQIHSGMTPRAQAHTYVTYNNYNLPRPFNAHWEQGTQHKVLQHFGNVELRHEKVSFLGTKFFIAAETQNNVELAVRWIEFEAGAPESDWYRFPRLRCEEPTLLKQWLSGKDESDPLFTLEDTKRLAGWLSFGKDQEFLVFHNYRTMDLFIRGLRRDFGVKSAA